MSQVRVLIADDSPMAQSVIRSVLETDPEIQVVGTAGDGYEAVSMVTQLRPDVVTMDIMMPRMDGFQAIERIMAKQPTPILVITSSRDAGTAFKSLSHGALEVIKKPELEENFRSSNFEEFNRRIKMISRVRVITHMAGRIRRTELNVRGAPTLKVIGIVASTGGPRALASILGSLPGELAASILVVQHMAEGFLDGMVTWLQNASALKIKMAEQDEILQAGKVYVGPHHHHMTVGSGLKIHLMPPDGIEGHCPSGNRLFSSLARITSTQTMGIVLTGMGNDGAEGLRVLRAAGGRTLAQDEETSLIFGMPKAALESGAAEKTTPLDEIPAEILSHAGMIRQPNYTGQS